MKKTGYEIIGMIKDGKAPKKIKYSDEEYILNDNDVIYTNNKHEINLLYLLNDEFEIIEESKVWKPKEGGEYWYLNDDGGIILTKWKYSIIDYLRYDIGNCFKTKEEAEKTLEKIKIYTQLKRYAEEHNTEKIDWANEKQNKYFISYNEIRDEISIDTSDIQDIVMICFNDYNVCKKAIKEIGEDNIKKLFED